MKQLKKKGFFCCRNIPTFFLQKKTEEGMKRKAFVILPFFDANFFFLFVFVCICEEEKKTEYK